MWPHISIIFRAAGDKDILIVDNLLSSTVVMYLSIPKQQLPFYVEFSSTVFPQITKNLQLVVVLVN